jgi:hypothetical protein
MQYSKIINIGSLNKANLEFSIPSMLYTIEKILGIHKEEKGLIYCNNLLIFEEMKSKISIASRLKCFLPDGPGNNENILEKFRCNRYAENIVLVSPSINSNIIKETECEFKIICKNPWKDMAIPEIAKIAKNKPKVYKESMIINLIKQIENNREEDHITYILDGSSTYWLKQFSYLIPPNIKKILNLDKL